MKFKNYYLLLALLCTSIISCDADSESEMATPSDPTGEDIASEKVKLYPVKLISYYDGKESMTEKLEYDENHKLIKRSVGKDNMTTYEYDNGVLVKEKNYTFGQFLTYSKFSYDDSGKLTKEELFDKNDKLSGYYLFESNANGLITSKTQYTNEDAIVLKFEYKYDDAKNVAERKYSWANDDGALITTSYDLNSFKYDDKHNIYKWVPAINKIGQLVNNSVEETRKNILKGETFTNVQKFQFKYNEYAYPISYTDENGDVEIKTEVEYEIVK